MIMIIGGAYQGKLAYAKEYLENFIEKQCVEGADASWDDLKNAQGVHGLHRFIWNEMEIQRHANPDMSILDWESWSDELAEKILETNPELMVITDEIGYGIVPIDKKERDFREVTGRVCIRLAKASTEVHRVICGIGTRIK